MLRVTESSLFPFRDGSLRVEYTNSDCRCIKPEYPVRIDVGVCELVNIYQLSRPISIQLCLFYAYTPLNPLVRRHYWRVENYSVYLGTSDEKRMSCPSTYFIYNSHD